MRPDQERVRNLLTDTVTLLCKNGLQYQKELRVQGLLGITLDDSDVFVVHINEKFGELLGGALSIRTDDGEGAPLMSAEVPSSPRSKVKRRCRSGETSPTTSSSHSVLQQPVKRRLKDSPLRATPIYDDTSNSRTEPTDLPFPAEVKVKTEADVILLDEGADLTADASAVGDISYPDAASFDSYGQCGNVMPPSAVDPGASTNPDFGSPDLTSVASGGPFVAGLWDPSHSGDRPHMENPPGMPLHADNSASNSMSLSPYPQSRYYRPRTSALKQQRCAYDGCGKTFYDRRSLLRHQTRKHGRPRYARDTRRL